MVNQNVQMHGSRAGNISHRSRITTRKFSSSFNYNKNLIGLTFRLWY